MKLEELMLTKKEIPLLYETCFQVPIHPKLLSPDVKIGQEIARETFRKAAQEWYDELKIYSETLTDPEIKKWINSVFLKKRPSIKNEYGHQVLSTLNWQDDFFMLDNGFVKSFTINRNFGGSLYINREELHGREFVPFDDTSGYIRFSKEKVIEFAAEAKVWDIERRQGATVYIYGQHNVDNYPGALFLRNWALLYLNEAMKQVLGTSIS